MAWTTSRKVEFQHCDPAGIVFYPRYFEFFNSAVHEFFDQVADYEFGKMHMVDRRGVPLVHVSMDFRAPSHLSETLTISLGVIQVGESSLRLHASIRGADESEPRIAGDMTLVHMDLDKALSCPWPESVKSAIQANARNE